METELEKARELARRSAVLRRRHDEGEDVSDEVDVLEAEVREFEGRLVGRLQS